jgi:hypothetical protein
VLFIFSSGDILGSPRGGNGPLQGVLEGIVHGDLSAIVGLGLGNMDESLAEVDVFP